MGLDKAISVSTLVPTSRVDEVSYLLWEMEILGLQELPPDEELYQPQAGTEFREPQSVDDWTKEEKLIETSSTRLKIYLPDSQEIFAEIKKFLDLQALPLVASEEVLPQKYIEEYKKRVQGKDFGAGLWIGPPWVGKAASEKNFIIDPGMAFGTGEHPTTQMIVEWLDQNHAQKFTQILDIGTGSGILAIAAKKFFPHAFITATDLDTNCKEEVPKNFALNALTLDQIELRCGDSADLRLLSESGKRFDLILSNIYGEVLARLAPDIEKLLSPQGTWVATGVLDGPARQAFESAFASHFTLKKSFERRDAPPNNAHLWLCYELQVMSYKNGKL